MRCLLRGQTLAQSRVSLRSNKKPSGQGPNIEAGSTHHKNTLATSGKSGNRFLPECSKPGHIKVFIRIDHINHMMRRLGLLGCGWLGRPNVQVAIHLT